MGLWLVCSISLQGNSSDPLAAQRQTQALVLFSWTSEPFRADQLPHLCNITEKVNAYFYPGQGEEPVTPHTSQAKAQSSEIPHPSPSSSEEDKL